MCLNVLIILFVLFCTFSYARIQTIRVLPCAMESNTKRSLPKVQTYWQELRSEILARVEPYRRLAALLLALVFALIVWYDVINMAELHTALSAGVVVCLIILPFVFYCSASSDVVGFLLKTVGDNFSFGNDMPKEIRTSKIKKYKSITYAVPLSPPRFLAYV